MPRDKSNPTRKRRQRNLIHPRRFKGLPRASSVVISLWTLSSRSRERCSSELRHLCFSSSCFRFSSDSLTRFSGDDDISNLILSKINFCNYFFNSATTSLQQFAASNSSTDDFQFKFCSYAVGQYDLITSDLCDLGRLFSWFIFTHSIMGMCLKCQLDNNDNNCSGGHLPFIVHCPDVCVISVQ